MTYDFVCAEAKRDPAIKFDEIKVLAAMWQLSDWKTRIVLKTKGTPKAICETLVWLGHHDRARARRVRLKLVRLGYLDELEDGWMIREERRPIHETADYREKSIMKRQSYTAKSSGKPKEPVVTTTGYSPLPGSDHYRQPVVTTTATRYSPLPLNTPQPEEPQAIPAPSDSLQTYSEGRGEDTPLNTIPLADISDWLPGATGRMAGALWPMAWQRDSGPIKEAWLNALQFYSWGEFKALLEAEVKSYNGHSHNMTPGRIIIGMSKKWRQNKDSGTVTIGAEKRSELDAIRAQLVELETSDPTSPDIPVLLAAYQAGVEEARR